MNQCPLALRLFLLRSLNFLLCLLAFCSPRPVLAQEASKPILLMGLKYSKYEREAIRRDILEPNELSFEDGGDFTSAELWKNYSLVIITHGMPDLSEKELGWIRDYLNNGGRLLLTGPVISSLGGLKGADRDWLGAASVRPVHEGPFSVSDTAKPYVSSPEAAAAVFRGPTSYGLVNLATATPLVTRDGASILARNTYGRGEVWFVGLEYFRILASQPTAAGKLAVGGPARDLLTKIILQGNTLKKADRIAAGLKTYGGTTPIVWRRDFSTARGAAFQEPPFPRPGESLSEIHLDLAEGEWESVPFNISTAAGNPHFTVTLTDLLPTTGGTGKIPASAIRLRVQGVPNPSLTVGSFWLLDCPRSGQATFSVPLQDNQSTSLWLTLNTLGLAPGEYRGEIRFSDPGMKPLPLHVRVWPIHLPGRQYFQTEATFVWSSLMPGQAGKSYDFPNPPGDMTAFRRHIADLAAHHITYNADVSWSGRFGKSVSLKNVRLRDSGIPLEEAIRKSLIHLDALPALDFSYFDPFVEIPLQAGIPYFEFNFKNTPQDWLTYAREITGDPNLPPDSPQHLAVKRWLYGECLRYLHSKGITKVVSFAADEISPDEIPDVTRRAALMRSAGAQVAFTATGTVGQKRENIAALNPAIDRWIWNTAVLPDAKAIVAKNSPLDAADEQWNYVADWHRAPYVFNRTRGAFCAFHQLDGLLIHGYLRWYPNGGAVYNTPEGPVDTEGWEGARDGIEDALLWKRAQMLLRAAKAVPALSAKALQLENEISGWVSDSPQSLVELHPAAYSIYKFQDPVSSNERLQTLKRDLLEALVWLDANVPVSQYVTYGGIPIVTAGKPVAQLAGDPTALTDFNHKLSDRGLPALTVSTTRPAVGIAIGTKAELSALVPASTLEPINLQPGSYQFVLQGQQLTIIGADAAGLSKAVDVLLTVMEVSEAPAPRNSP